jgi:endonuclease/exonuclease/phosphatase family metal-dependent hydrolase
MRIVSWNVNHWQRHEPDRWARVLRALQRMGAQVALLQEVLPPTGDPSRVLFHAIDDTNPRLRWGTAIVAVDESVQLDEWRLVPVGQALEARHVELSHPGTMVVADATVDGEPACTLVCLYGQQIWTANGTTYTSTTVHRQISDLVPLLDSHGRRVLVAGDLNVTTQWDTRARDQEMDRSVFDRMCAHGFRELVTASVPKGYQADCFCPDAGRCQHIRTLRLHNKLDSRPWHNDYAFASPSLAASASVLDDEQWWALSDHAPVLVSVEPPST